MVNEQGDNVDIDYVVFYLESLREAGLEDAQDIISIQSSIEFLLELKRTIGHA